MAWPDLRKKIGKRIEWINTDEFKNYCSSLSPVRMVIMEDDISAASGRSIQEITLPIGKQVSTDASLLRGMNAESYNTYT
jgi:hypothetical protein